MGLLSSSLTVVLKICSVGVECFCGVVGGKGFDGETYIQFGLILLNVLKWWIIRSFNSGKILMKLSTTRLARNCESYNWWKQTGHSVLYWIYFRIQSEQTANKYNENTSHVWTRQKYYEAILLTIMRTVGNNACFKILVTNSAFQ